MNLPGFTAESSLERGDNRYQLAEIANDLRKKRGIIPQKPIILDCFCFRSFSYCCCRGEDGKYVCGKTLSA